MQLMRQASVMLIASGGLAAVSTAAGRGGRVSGASTVTLIAAPSAVRVIDDDKGARG